MPLLVEPDEHDETDTSGPRIGRRRDAIPDDRLRLIFTCCHPALAREAQVALTLRLVCGVTTGDIAQAFLVSEPTMAARLTRAKKKISAAHIPYRVPAGRGAAGPARRRPHRHPPAVHHRAHGAVRGATGARGPGRAGDGPGPDAAGLMPDERGGARAAGVAAAHRRPARDPHGCRRSAAAARGAGPLALGQGRHRGGAPARPRRRCGAATPGRFALQAAIAALHAQAPSYDETDWQQILVLYDELLKVWPSPVVALNRAVAVAEVRGPEVALPRSRHWSETGGWPATGTCRRPRPTCCAGSAATTRRPLPTAQRSTSPTTRPNAGSSPRGWPNRAVAEGRHPCAESSSQEVSRVILGSGWGSP